MTHTRTSVETRVSADTQPAAVVAADRWGYQHAGRKSWAARNISMRIEAGEKVLVAGASGAGKSTLLHGIAGVLGEDEGEHAGSLTVLGENPDSPKVRGQVGLVQQDPESQRVMETVGDEVAFGLENLGVPQEQIWPKVEAALETVGLDVPLDHPTSHLSGGQKQRLALACAFAMKPALILLDEPTANLDPAGAREVLDATNRLATQNGLTLVIVDHNLGQWLDHVDRLIVLDEGGVQFDGPARQVVEGNRDELIALGLWLPNMPRMTLDSIQGTQLTGGTAASTEWTVEVSDLAVGYGDAAVAKNLNFRFPRGQATFITGENGAGKSTLALTLAGLMRPLAGHQCVCGEVAKGLGSTDPNDWATREVLGRISMVFQEPQYQFLTSSVEQELALGLTLAGVDGETADSRVEHYLHRLRLEKLRQAHPMSLSGGEKRRLAVGTALISAPALLILDEPTFGQDRNTWENLVHLLAQAQSEGTTLIVVTHDEELVETLADQRVHLERQRDRRPRPRPHPLKDRQARRRWSFLSRVNPAIQVLALMLLTVPLLFSIDPVSAAIALGLELLLLPLVGLRPRQLLLRAAPLLIAGPLAGISMALYGRVGGEIFFAWGPVIVSENSLTLAASLSLRVFAVGLPAVIILPSLNATAMADSLIQIVRLPARMVIASLAGIRMVGLMVSDWRALGRARRSRGLSGHHFFRSTFQLLTFALRRAESLTVSMEARGFGSDLPRTNARTSTLSRADLVMLLVAAAIPAIALGVAVATGSFTWFGLR